MRLQDFMAERYEGIGRFVAHWIETTPPETRTWLPPVPGSAMTRTIADMLAEFICVNRYVLSAFGQGTAPEGHPMHARPDFDTLEEGIATFLAGVQAVAACYRTMDDADLEAEHTFAGRTIRGVDMLEIPYRNLCYHGGQINLLQLLAGDSEMHRRK